MRTFITLTFLLGALLVTTAAQAQDTLAPVIDLPSGTNNDAHLSLPASHYIEGMEMVWQQLNRCSAAALAIQLSYFDWGGTYTDTIRGLNPHAEDVSVRLDEMITFAEDYGLIGIERFGGTVEMLKILVGNGFPVLVEATYYDGADYNRDWMSHNRVIIGYDDAEGVVYALDSLLGAGDDGRGRRIPYQDVFDRWQPFNRNYLVLYRPGDEPLLQALMGDQWDAEYNAEWALAQAEAEVNGANPNSFAAFNMGSSLVLLGRYEEAAAAYDRARAIGLPWRMMWYQFGPFEAYLQVGRYDDVIQLARQVIEGTPGVEESYYYIARAYRAQGDLQRAEANLEVAVLRNPNFIAAIDELQDLRAELGESS
jgi:tetratricopeptide (TPR) repeat protein